MHYGLCESSDYKRCNACVKLSYLTDNLLPRSPRSCAGLRNQADLVGSLSRDVFERRTSTGSELFSLLVCLDANKFVLLSFFSPLKTIYSRVSTKPLPNDAKSSLPVDVRRSKTLLLKLPSNRTGTLVDDGARKSNNWLDQ